MYHLIDTHAHLEEIEEIDQVIAKARAANVAAIVAVGSNYESNKKVLALAREHKGFIFPALGMHPWHLRDADAKSNLEFIESHIDKVVGIGEVGLDYHKRVRERADKEAQIDVLRPLLELGKSYKKPVLIHSRYAWRDAFNLVKEAKIEKAVFHWYTGTSSVLRDVIDHGYYLSATPAVEYHEEHRRAVKEVPLERLLLETDSPVTYRRGTEFEFEARPADVVRTLKGVYQLRGLDEPEIAGITTRNANELFSPYLEIISPL
jgi:TatD DNase family protein